MTFDEKVRLYLERSAQCEDGDTEELGKEIVQRLAKEHAERNSTPYSRLIFKEPGLHTAFETLPTTNSNRWACVRRHGKLVFQNEEGTIVPFHAVKMAIR